MLLADSVVIGGSLPSARDDSETPIKAAPQIWRAVVTASMDAKAVSRVDRQLSRSSKFAPDNRLAGMTYSTA